MVPNQGGHHHSWIIAAAADTRCTHLSEVQHPTLLPKRRLQEGYGAKGVAAAQQRWGFHPGGKGEGDGGRILNDVSRKVSGARGCRRRRSRQCWLGISPGQSIPSPSPPSGGPASVMKQARAGGRTRQISSGGGKAARFGAAEAEAAAAPRPASTGELAVLTAEGTGPRPRHLEPRVRWRLPCRGRHPGSRGPPRARRGSRRGPAATFISSAPGLAGGCLRRRRGEDARGEGGGGGEDARGEG